MYWGSIEVNTALGVNGVEMSRDSFEDFLAALLTAGIVVATGAHLLRVMRKTETLQEGDVLTRDALRELASSEERIASTREAINQDLLWFCEDCGERTEHFDSLKCQSSHCRQCHLRYYSYDGCHCGNCVWCYGHADGNECNVCS